MRFGTCGSVSISIIGLVTDFRSYVSPVAQMDKDSTEYLDIDARKREKNQYLDKVMNDMSIGGESKDLDLLGLMDEA